MLKRVSAVMKMISTCSELHTTQEATNSKYYETNVYIHSACLLDDIKVTTYLCTMYYVLGLQNLKKKLRHFEDTALDTFSRYLRALS